MWWLLAHGKSLSALVVNTAVQRDVDAKGQEFHGIDSTPSWVERWTVIYNNSEVWSPL